jgi:hypothetical protein
VIKACESGKLDTSHLRGRVRPGLTKVESALMRFLEARQSKIPARN